MKKNNTKKAPELKPRKVKGRIEILKAIPYRGIMVYLRKINDDIFEYLIPYKGEIYADYLIMKPKKGKKKLTKNESNQAAALILNGAVVTIDVTLLKKKVSKKDIAFAREFEKATKKTFGKNSKKVVN